MKEVAKLLVSLQKSLITNKKGYIQLFILTSALSIIGNTSYNLIKSIENTYIKTAIQIVQLILFTITAYINLYLFQSNIIKHSSKNISESPIIPIRKAVFIYIKVLASQSIIAIVAIIILFYGVISSISTHDKLLVYFIFIMLIAITLLFLLYWFIRLTFIGNITALRDGEYKSKEIIRESKLIIKENIKAVSFIYIINVFVIATGLLLMKIKVNNWAISFLSSLFSIIVTVFSTSTFTTIYVNYLDTGSIKTDNQLKEKIV